MGVEYRVAGEGVGPQARLQPEQQRHLWVLGFWGLGFWGWGFWGVGFWGLGFEVLGCGVGTQLLEPAREDLIRAARGSRVSGARFQASGFGLWVQGFGFRVSGLKFQGSDFGFRGPGLVPDELRIGQGSRVTSPPPPNAAASRPRPSLLPRPQAPPLASRAPRVATACAGLWIWVGQNYNTAREEKNIIRLGLNKT